VRLCHLEPFDVLLRRSCIGRLGEDEDLALDPGLQLLEALVDGAPVAQHLDVLERVVLLLPGVVGRAELVDQGCGLPLEIRELLTLVGDETLERQLRRDGRVLRDLPRARRGKALFDQAREDVVDALAWDAGQPRRLRGGRRVAPEKSEIRLGLVAGEPEARELGGSGHTSKARLLPRNVVSKGARRVAAHAVHEQLEEAVRETVRVAPHM
jgi:hypothetical protein